jgi:hypothetical protein
MASGESEKLIEAVADRAREALEEAERQAQEIVAQAEGRAEEIVTGAEARAKEVEAEAAAKAAKTVALSEDQARDRIERARKALDELGVALGSGEPAEAPSAAEEALAPEPEPEDQELGSDPTPDEATEPGSDTGSDPSGSGNGPANEPEAKPSTEELIAQLKGGDGDAKAGEGTTDDAAARLVAMNMALEGASRDEVESHLADEFGSGDRGALLDEVFDRVGK